MILAANLRKLIAAVAFAVPFASTQRPHLAAPEQLRFAGVSEPLAVEGSAVWGPIESNWRRGPAATEYEFAIPANAQATVQLRTGSAEDLRIDGAVVDKAPGVISSKMKSGKAELVLGSGHYRISAPNPEGGR